MKTFHEELTEAFGENGCALCRLGARTVARYLDILAYENVNDVALRGTIREGLGLCNAHAWQFVDETRAPLGTAIIYRDLIRTLQQRTARPLSPAGDVQRRLDGLVPRQRCVACAALATSIQDCAHQIHRSWKDPRFRIAYQASDGLCWPHLLATIDADRFARHWNDLVAAQRDCWDRRVSRAQHQQSAAPLLEALASAPRLNGTRIEAMIGNAAAVTPLGDDLTPTVEQGRCPVCAAVEERVGALSPLPPPTAHGGGGRIDGLSCAVHAWRAADLRDPNQVAALAERLRGLAERASVAVRDDTTGSAVLRVAERIRRGSGLPPRIANGLDCPFCRAQLSDEIHIVTHLKTATLCAPHLRVAAYHAPSFAEVRADTRSTWHVIETQLDEVIRKYDYRFQQEPRGEEQKAPRWAVALLAGREGVR